MTQFNSSDVQNIKDNRIGVPKEGVYSTAESGAELQFKTNRDGDYIYFTIEDQFMNADDIKELRKFLKILEAEIK